MQLNQEKHGEKKVSGKYFVSPERTSDVNFLLESQNVTSNQFQHTADEMLIIA